MKMQETNIPTYVFATVNPGQTNKVVDELKRNSNIEFLAPFLIRGQDGEAVKDHVKDEEAEEEPHRPAEARNRICRRMGVGAVRHGYLTGSLTARSL